MPVTHEIIIEKGAYSAAFDDVFNSQDRYLILFGGRGASKSDVMYLKYLVELFKPYYFRLAYVNKEKANIRDQQYAGFKRVAKRCGLFDMLKFYDGDYRIINEQNGNCLIPKGMDDPEKTKGLDDITAIWWDEINKGTADDFFTLNALLRSPQAEYLQFAISFNPVSESHWLRKTFFDKDDAYALNETYGPFSMLHHSTYKDNDFIDKEAYLNTLKQNAHGNINRMLVDIEGRWGVMQNDNPFFYAFDMQHNFVDRRFQMPDSMTYVYLSFDFNNNPCTLIVGMIDGKELAVMDLIACDENTEHGLSPLEACCHKFVQKYIVSGIVTSNRLIITGDASGRQKTADNVANKNFYTKICHALRISDSQVKVRRANISHALSREICNSALYNCDVKIYKSAQMLTEDMMKAYADDAGTLNKAKKEHGLHFTDAFRYLLDCMLNFDEWHGYIRYYAKAS